MRGASPTPSGASALWCWSRSATRRSLVWVYASECFPVRLHTQGGSAMLREDLFANFIVGVVFLGALGSLGGSVTFGIFLGLVSFAFDYVLAPETKGRPLQATDHLVRSRSIQAPVLGPGADMRCKK